MLSLKRTTEWKLFLMKVMGNNNTDANIHKRSVNKIPLFNKYSREEAEEMLFSPEWTRAVFVRDPKERLLSGYLDKAVQTDEIYRQFRRYGNCCDNKENRGLLRQCADEAKASLGGFLNHTTRENCDDVHWNPQAWRIEEKYWPIIDFVGHMDTAAEDAKTLLKTVGAWDEFGKTGWGVDGKQPFMAKAFGSKHTSGAKEKLRKYFTPELERWVEEVYKEDYESRYMKIPMNRIFE